MSNEKIQAGLDKYNATVEKAAAKFPMRQSIPEQGLYTPLDIKDTDYAEDIGFPGVYPYTRGVQPTMYRGRFWTMRMYAGFSTAEESNKRYRYLIESGATGLSCAFDLPTQIGYDSTDPISEGEVGKVGVAIDSLADMEILFDQIDLGKVSTSMTINAPASVLLAMYIAVAEKQGVSADKLKGTIQNDILKEYAARGPGAVPRAPLPPWARAAWHRRRLPRAGGGGPWTSAAGRRPSGRRRLGPVSSGLRKCREVRMILLRRACLGQLLLDVPVPPNPIGASARSVGTVWVPTSSMPSAALILPRDAGVLIVVS